MDTVTISGKLYDEATVVKEREEYIRLEAVDLNFALSQLIYDDSSLVRTAVARKKVGHEILVNDPSWRVRAMVAQYTDDTTILDKLTHDEHDFVRFVIVKREHNLEVYLDDKDEEVAAIARYLIQQQQQE